MQQHPIPQNVTTYQFRLIGDMTIKQFIYLSVGVCAAVFFYYTNLFSLIKWFLIAGSAILGFAIAFLPMEERPLDQWLLAYIRAIYRPTRYIWHKDSPIPSFFSFVPNNSVLPSDAQELARIAVIRKQQGLRSYLITLPEEQGHIDLQEQSQIGNVLSLFNAPVAAAQFTPAVPAATLNIAVSGELDTAPQVGSSPSGQSSSRPPAARNQPSGVIATSPIRIEREIERASEDQLPQTETHIAQPLSDVIATKNLNIPTVAATTTSTLPFPSTPTTPNTVVGMVLDQHEKIIDNAILEVIDESGLPVRATKTNQLGQFFSTTPLKRGIYRLTIEKPGFSFDTIELNLNGQIVEPLKIQAK